MQCFLALSSSPTQKATFFSLVAHRKYPVAAYKGMQNCQPRERDNVVGIAWVVEKERTTSDAAKGLPGKAVALPEGQVLERRCKSRILGQRKPEVASRQALVFWANPKVSPRF